jgi:recombination protein RecA
MSNLDKLMNKINKSMGENTIKFGGSPDIRVFPSGSLTLDLALGRGGIPRGRLVEVYGPTGAGKTTVAMLHGAEVQRENQGKVAFIDAEHTFDPVLATEYGLNLDELIYVDPKSAENAIDIADALVRSEEVRLIIIDSVSALTPSKVVESSIEQQTMALLARFMSTTCQKLNGPAYQNDCTIMFINQVREKVGVMYGNPETTSGGRALPFYSSIRLAVRAGDQLKDKDEVFGHIIKIKVTKNKVGTPFKEAHFPLIYGKGIDKVDEISQLAVFGGIIRQAGAWFRYEDEEGEVIKRHGKELKFQGRAAFVEYLREDQEFKEEIENRLRGIEIEAPIGDPVEEEGYDSVLEEKKEKKEK